MALIEGLILLVIVIYLLYKYGTNTFTYWTSRGVYQLETFPFLGTSADGIFAKASQKETMELQYRKIKNRSCRFGGLYFFRKPSLMIVDPELIKLITVKDFDYFMNRTAFVEEDQDPLFGKTLFTLANEKWKNVRNTLSPAFTTAKLKNMFPLVDNCVVQVSEHIDELINKQMKDNHPDGNLLTVDLKDLLTRFTCDVTATTGFGLKVDSLKEPENTFYRMAKHVTDFSGQRFILTLFLFALPKLIQVLKISLFGRKATEFYLELVGNTIKTRQEQNIQRPDMIQLLMQARQGTLYDDEGSTGIGKTLDLTDHDITAQVISFIFGGFESTATLLSFALHEIAINEGIQEKLQEEIDRVVEEDGKLTYDGVMHRMTYLDMVVSETLRKWSPGVMTDRKVSKRYVIPATKQNPEITLKEGDMIIIPIAGLHADPEYFPDPDRFDPERFNEGNKHKIHPFTYFPFGQGPRMCIGNRYALMNTKTCLVHLLQKYKLEVVSKTPNPIKLKKASILNIAEGGLWLGFRRREDI